MSTTSEASPPSHGVVVNEEEQYSIWLLDRPLPPGWKRVDASGSKEQCLAHVQQVWTDIRPGSVRRDAGRAPESRGLSPDIFEETARRHPDRPALTFCGDTLTYADLNAWSNRVAEVLRHDGIGVESTVGLLFERSLEMVVSVVAVLKRGAAYMPMAPDHPHDRLRDQLAESKVALVLTQTKFLGPLADIAGPATRLLAVDDEASASTRPAAGAEMRQWGAHNPPRAHLHAENAINLIFTSGSTGKPKGVVNRYGSIRNRIEWMQRTYQLSPADSVLQKTPFTFDVSGWEILWPLMEGARMVLARPGGHKDPDYLADLIESEQITVIHFVPSMLFAFLTEENLPSRCASLRMIFSSGEELSPSLLASCHATFGCDLHNLYGPTEAAIDVTSWKTERGWSGRVPIGRPIDGCRAHILDEQMMPVVEGSEGELFLGGAGLARGYINSPSLTAEKFVPDPFSSVPGDRLYRTGDLARLGDEGLVEYLGRIDTQIKVRGLRIELTEIEGQLEAYPAIERAAVCSLQNSSGTAVRLVAFYVTSGAEEIAPAALRSHLASYLPDYMVPHHFFQRDQLHVSDSGKLDRKSLAGIARVLIDREVADDTRVDGQDSSSRRVLHRIWCQALSCERAGDEDNFFERGGDSIQALLLTAQARKAGLKISARDIYEKKRFGALVSFVDQRSASQHLPRSSGSGVDWSQRPTVEHVPLTPIQRWFFEHAPDGLDHWNQSLLLECRAPLDPGILERAFHELLSRHDAFFFRFARTQRGWEASYQSSPPAGGFHCFPAGQADPEQASVAIQRRCERLQASLDIASGRLAALALFPAAWEGHDVLFFAVHHLVVDGISWRVLIPELESLYFALRDGTPHDLPLVPVTYGQWSLQLREFASRSELSSERALWQQVCDEPAAQKLPRSGAAEPAEPNLGHDLCVHHSSFSPVSTEVLLHQLPRFYQAHINEILLAALAVALADLTGSETTRIMLEGHGREDIHSALDTSRTVGWFTSIFPINLSAPKGASLQAVLSRTKERFRSLPRKGFSYSILKFLSEGGIGAGHEIAPDVMFNYLGQFDSLFGAAALFAPLFLDRGPERDPSARRFEVLYIEGASIGGCLRFDWHYNSTLLSCPDVTRLADAFGRALQGLADHYLGAITASEALGARASSWYAQADVATAAALSSQYPRIQSVAPLLPLQQGILFHTLLSDDPATYAVSVRVEIQGPLDPVRLLQSWRAVEAATDILRCRVVPGWDAPLLVFLEASECPFDITEAAGEEPAGATLRLHAMDREPAIAIQLSRISDEPSTPRWLFSWTHSHVLLDGTSVQLVLHDLFHRYVRSVDQGAGVRDGTRSFSHFAFVHTWEQAAPAALADRCFWKSQLGDLGVPAPLPHDPCASTHGHGVDAQPVRRCASPQVTSGGEAPFGLVSRRPPSDLSKDRLRDAARLMGVTPITLFYAAWALLLGKLTDRREVVFLTTHSLRSLERPEFEKTVGMCLNTLPLRVPLEDEATLSAWCRRVLMKLTDAQAHGNFSLHDILSSNPEVREELASRSTLLNIEAYPDVLQPHYGPLRIISFESFEQPTYPLTMNVKWTGSTDTYDLELLFSLAEYEPDEAERLIEVFESALRAIIAAPEETLGSVRLRRGEELSPGDLCHVAARR